MTSPRTGHIQGQPPRRRVSNPPPSPPPSPPRPRFGVRGLPFQRNQELLRNAGSLLATTGLTSVLGFAFWIYAAHFFTAKEVGYGSAAISTMMLLGTIGEFGIGTMLIGELARRRNRGGLMTASIIASFIISFVLGLGFSLVSIPIFGSHFAEINGDVSRMIIFSFGVAITGATLVFDEATIGLMRGGLQLRRNVTVSIAKMVALPATALVFHDKFGVGIMAAWVVGTVFSLGPTAFGLKRAGTRILYPPDWATFWSLRKVTLAHNSLNLAIATPAKVIPVLVSVVVPPAANGAYYIATMISSFLTMLPSSLSTVLFAVAAASPEKIGEKLRFVLRMSLYIGIPAGLAMALCSRFMLSLFSSSDAAMATGPLIISIVAYVPGLPGIVYIAVARATGKVNQAAVFFTVFLALRMAAVVVGGKLGGLYGLSYGMLGVMIVQACFATPPVLRTAYGKSVPIPRVADRVTSGQEKHRPIEDAEQLRLRQEAGLAALLSIATATSRPRRPPPLPPPQTDTGRGRRRRPAGPLAPPGSDPYATSRWSAPNETSSWPDRRRAPSLPDHPLGWLSGRRSCAATAHSSPREDSSAASWKRSAQARP
jgi:O-antigen/teichoic acid export membrane protein